MNSQTNMLIIGFMLLIPLLPALQADEAPVSPCEAFRHPEEYLGRALVVDGILLYGEHGAFLEVPSCPRGVLRLAGNLSDAEYAGYKKAGGRKGVGVLATVRGRIEASKTNRQPVFRISSVSNIRNLRD